MDNSAYTFDPGTGILDKASITAYSLEALKNVESAKSSVWLAVMDIDDFKNINDTYGHAFGNAAIMTIVKIFSQYLDGVGAIGRYGTDDEFMVCVNDANEDTIREMLRLARRDIADKTRENMFEGNGVTLSVGAVSSPLNGTDFEDLFNKADKALYIAKAKGKNRYIIYREEMHGSVKMPKNIGSIRYVQDYSLKLAENVNNCIYQLMTGGKEKLRFTQALMIDTFSLNLLGIYWKGRKSGVYIPVEEDQETSKSFFSFHENADYVVDDAIPEFDQDIIDEIKSSPESFASGLVVINNYGLNKDSRPATSKWMKKTHIREIIIYYPFSNGHRIEPPIYVMGSNIMKKWGAEDPHYFMVYANFLGCLLETNKSVIF